MRGVDLAIYADALAGESASLAARAERAHSRLRQAAIEKRARSALSESAAERLEALGLLGSVDEAATRAELRELEAALDALDELQTWVEAELVRNAA
ncbi:MAG: hypothetical protein E6F97_00325 [Actinobacteria bacterium]|nr:MAG: hypothetical protein E6F97_00325 [Actinomycetota bacterium]